MGSKSPLLEPYFLPFSYVISSIFYSSYYVLKVGILQEPFFYHLLPPHKTRLLFWYLNIQYNSYTPLPMTYWIYMYVIILTKVVILKILTQFTYDINRIHMPLISHVISLSWDNCLHTYYGNLHEWSWKWTCRSRITTYIKNNGDQNEEQKGIGVHQ